MYNVELIALSDVCDDESFIEEIDVIITSIDDTDLDFGAAVLPNPNEGIFNVRISDFSSRDFEIDLIDMTGRVIEHRLIQSLQGDTIERFEKASLSAGIYFVKIRNEDSVKTLKIVVQ